MGKLKSLFSSSYNWCRSLCHPRPIIQSQTEDAEPLSPIPEPATTSYQSVDLDRVEALILKILQNAKKELAPHGKHHSSEWKLPESSDITQLNDFLSVSTDYASDLKTALWGEHSEELNDVVKSVVEGIGNVHWTTAGLLVVAFVLERFHLISSNKEDCLGLLDEMYGLCKYIKQATQIVRGEQHFSELLQHSFELVVEGSILCCAQREAGWLSKFMTASAQKERLESLRAQLNKTYTYFMLQLALFNANRSTQEGIRPPRKQLFPYFAVGIKHSIARVQEMLELESKEPVIVVTIYGLGGVGKTTLANAVYASIPDNDFRFSRIVLFDNVDIKPNVTKKQKAILHQVAEKGTYEQVASDSEGQEILRQVFQKEQCFLYIDNVLDALVLSKLLPQNLHRSKRLRILLTARDANATSHISGFKCLKKFPLDTLQHEHSVAVFAQAMADAAGVHDSLSGLSSEDLDYVIKSCGGIPLALEMVGRFIQSQSDKQIACKLIREEHQLWEGARFGTTDLDFYAFALKGLPQELIEAFFDICAFFRRDFWSSIEYIFGELVVQMLENRALIKRRPIFQHDYSEGDFQLKLKVETKDAVEVDVHDVILEIAQRQMSEEGKRITTFEELTELLHCDEEKVLNSIKGIRLLPDPQLHNSTVKLPATKLDTMSSSLRIFYDVHLKIEGLCKESFQEIIVCSCTSTSYETPFDISKCPKLKRLEYKPTKTIDFSRMPNSIATFVADFTMLPQDVLPFDTAYPTRKDSLLPNLKAFLIRALGSLNQFPKGILCSFKSLSVLCIRDCPNLSELPDEFKNLSHLKMFFISNCESLKQLPRSLTDCVSLRLFYLGNCKEIRNLPEGMGRLSSLESLKLTECKALKGLPEDIGGCTRLQVISTSACEEMEQLPSGLGKLCFLKILALDRCRNLKKLCEDLQSLSSLQVLDLHGCTALAAECVDMLVKMENLRLVDISECNELIERWEEIQDQHASVKFVY